MNLSLRMSHKIFIIVLYNMCSNSKEMVTFKQNIVMQMNYSKLEYGQRRLVYNYIDYWFYSLKFH